MQALTQVNVNSVAERLSSVANLRLPKDPQHILGKVDVKRGHRLQAIGQF